MHHKVAGFIAVCVWITGCLIDAATVSADQLRLVQILWRHGDRSPCHLIPNDPNNTLSTWPQGLCELTPVGMKQHFMLGQWLRKRYSGYMSEDYQQREIYIRSTENNRTIQSAMANMAGFYFPPVKNQTFNRSLPWFPFPVHSTIDVTDSALNQDAPCKKAALYFAEMLTDPDFLKVLAENEKLLAYLIEHAKYPILNSYDVVGNLYDTLNAEYDHLDTHTPPTWANRTIFNDVVQMYSKVISFLFKYPGWKKLRGGVLYGDIVQMMQQKAAGNWSTLSPDLKMYIYSAHDTTIQALLQAMDAFNSMPPPYASAVIVELRETDGNYFVEMFYQNTTDHSTPNLPPAHRLKIGNCSQPCPLNDLVKLAAPVIPTNWKKECEVFSIGEQQPTKPGIKKQRGKSLVPIPEEDLAILRKYMSEKQIASLTGISPRILYQTAHS